MNQIKAIDNEFKKYDWVHLGVDSLDSFEEIRPIEGELINILNNNGEHKLNLLEIGCGYGRSTLRFAQAGLNVTGIDTNVEAVKKFNIFAKEHNLQATGLVADAMNYKLNYQSWDIIVCEYTLHCLKKEDAIVLLNRIKLGTKRNGLNLLTEFTSVGDAFDDETKELFFHPSPDYLKNSYITDGWALLKYYESFEPTKIGPRQLTTQLLLKK